MIDIPLLDSRKRDEKFVNYVPIRMVPGFKVTLLFVFTRLGNFVTFIQVGDIVIKVLQNISK